MRPMLARPSPGPLLAAALAGLVLATTGCDKIKPTQPPVPQVDPAPAVPAPAASGARAPTS